MSSSEDDNGKGNLEKIIMAQEYEEVLPLDQHISNFTERYNKEKQFREIVHNYLKLSGFKKAVLFLEQKFLPSRYDRKTDVLVQEYAKKIREDLIKVAEVKKELLELKKVAYDLENKAGGINEAKGLQQTVQQQYQEAVINKDSAVKQVGNDTYARIKEEEERSVKEIEDVKRLTDAEDLAKKKLKDIIVSSTLIKTDEHGVLSFDEQKICEKLEDVFLKEIIDGIEKEDGNTGFVARIKTAYSGLISHYDVIEDLGELPDTDWIESTIFSRTKGYRAPAFPCLITGKYEKRAKGKVSIDTAVALDSSSSMDENNRFVVAKKTALATVALMRKLNPKNQTYLSHFNGGVYPVTSSDLIRSVNPYNGTATELALGWLLNTLSDSMLSIAYLITDGDPNRLEDTIATAKKFNNYPNVLLRIFLIDGNKETEEKIWKIGRAAGPATKVVPVKNYQLSGGVIRDISKAIGDMYSIT